MRLPEPFPLLQYSGFLRTSRVAWALLGTEPFCVRHESSTPGEPRPLPLVRSHMEDRCLEYPPVCGQLGGRGTKEQPRGHPQGGWVGLGCRHRGIPVCGDLTAPFPSPGTHPHGRCLPSQATFGSLTMSTPVTTTKLLTLATISTSLQVRGVLFVSVQDTLLVMEGQVRGEDGGGALPFLGGGVTARSPKSHSSGRGGTAYLEGSPRLMGEAGPAHRADPCQPIGQLGTHEDSVPSLGSRARHAS